MLNLSRRRNRHAPDEISHDTQISHDTWADNPDLHMRSLLDYPRLREVMGLDAAPDTARPERPLNRRRLLESAAA